MLAIRSIAWMLLGSLVLALAVWGCGSSGDDDTVTLRNVSYDPTRQLYSAYNTLFAEHWAETTGGKVRVEASHGGSGKQARKVIEGIEADVVTLALAYDIDAIAEKAQLLPADWQTRLPNNSAPYTSTIVFLVRKDNPQGIRDWDDLIRPDVKIITPNPKTSGGARWNYLAAWGYALKRELRDFAKLSDPTKADEVARAQSKAREFVAKMIKQVYVSDSGAREATMTFVQRRAGDVLLAWENEALYAVTDSEFGNGEYEVITPSISILAEPTVAVVDKVVDKRATRAIAEAYLKYLYSSEAQNLVAKHHYRPTHPELVHKDLLAQFKETELFTIDQVFGGWKKAQQEHFADGGIFDQIIESK